MQPKLDANCITSSTPNASHVLITAAAFEGLAISCVGRWVRVGVRVRITVSGRIRVRVRVTGTVRVAVTVTVCYRFCAIGHVLDGARVTESRYR